MKAFTQFQDASFSTTAQNQSTCSTGVQQNLTSITVLESTAPNGSGLQNEVFSASGHGIMCYQKFHVMPLNPLFLVCHFCPFKRTLRELLPPSHKLQVRHKMTLTLSTQGLIAVFLSIFRAAGAKKMIWSKLFVFSAITNPLSQ